MRIGKHKATKLTRTIFVRAAASALFYSGAINALRSSRIKRWSNDQKARNVSFPFIVLLYHRVNPHNDPYFPAISVRAFDSQIRYLTANYHVTPLVKIVDKISQGEEIAPGTIAITFDDGYRDNYVYAHPILRKYNCPATLFAATSYIGTERLMWNDKLALAMKLSTRKSVSIPGSTQSLSLVAVPERIFALNQILEHLKAFSEAKKIMVLEAIFNSLAREQPKPEPVMLSWNELRQMAHEGWEIGSHTANHVILTRVPLCQAKEEIRSSGAILERELGLPIRLFAYPNGKPADYDIFIKECLRKSGYIGGVTTVDGANAYKVDPFEIGRKSAWEESVSAFALRLSRSFWRRT